MIAAAGSYAEAQGKVLIDEPLTAEQLQKTIQVLVKNGTSYTLECYHGNYTYFYTAKELVSTVTPPELLAILGMQRVLKRSMRLKPDEKIPRRTGVQALLCLPYQGTDGGTGRRFERFL